MGERQTGYVGHPEVYVISNLQKYGNDDKDEEPFRGVGKTDRLRVSRKS